MRTKTGRIRQFLSLKASHYILLSLLTKVLLKSLFPLNQILFLYKILKLSHLVTMKELLGKNFRLIIFGQST